MKNVFEFSVEPSYETYASANWLVIRARPLFKRPWLSVLGIWALYVAFTLFGGEEYLEIEDMVVALLSGLVWAVIMAAILFPLTKAASAWQMRRQVADLRKIAPQTKFHLSPDTLRTENAISSQTLTWEHFKRGLENDKVLVLMVTNLGMIVVPKAAAGSDAVDFLRARLIAAGVPLG